MGCYQNSQKSPLDLSVLFAIFFIYFFFLQVGYNFQLSIYDITNFKWKASIFEEKLKRSGTQFHGSIPMILYWKRVRESQLLFAVDKGDLSLVPTWPFTSFQYLSFSHNYILKIIHFFSCFSLVFKDTNMCLV